MYGPRVRQDNGSNQVAYVCDRCGCDTGEPFFMTDAEGYTVVLVRCVLCGELTV